MDEIWERAVETALDGQTDHAATRTLTLDGAVKCVQGRLPPPSLLEKFENLQHLSIANIGVSSLEQFPRLRNLQKLILSDNRIAGGLEFLVEAGLDSLRDLDLSNNRIQYIEDLAPLAQLKLVSLDLYECPVTRVKDYRSRVFGLIKSLKYLDKMDAEENERPESDDEEDDEEEEDEDDPGSGEIDGEDRPYRINNGHSEGGEGIVDVDEDEESDADEEETETGRRVNGQSHEANGFRIEEVGRDEDEDEEDDDDDENDSGEEVDDDYEEEDDVVEVHEIGDSDDEEDGVEDDEDDDDDEDDEEEEVDNDEGDFAEPESTGRLTSTEGEIDGHEHGEDDGDEDDNGETGEEEQGVEDDGEFDDEEEGEDEDEDFGEGYLVQPVGQAEEHDAGGSDMDPGNEEDDAEVEEEVEDDEEVQVLPSSSHLKRKRSDDAEKDDDVEDDEEEDDVVEFAKASKKHR
ncbi:acidic leucine-rich nuclear phosphoprotein 32-related protein [Herrania umbratica]|uniref:Acidic leucine-rich nuclear phosphoprotein 32-related protein n=1 Tax=Herrania umbratica TaxID=108875 RepID=A0A6J0ZKY1_9ROSI|nr:acidic leucine-rich nuclear phosphoprotein 32-related protein [Herrania umbratica]